MTKTTQNVIVKAHYTGFFIKKVGGSNEKRATNL